MKEVGTVKLENKNIENIGDIFKYQKSCFMEKRLISHNYKESN